MLRTFRMGMALGVGVLLAGSLWANDNDKPMDKPTDRPMDKPAMSKEFTPKLLKVDTLIGQEVVNDKGEKLGRLHDVVLSRQLDRISYAVIAHGGVLGVGDKYTAVPWQALDPQPEAKKTIFAVDKSAFDQSPGFDKKNWPESGDQKWLQQVRQGQRDMSMDRPGQRPSEQVKDVARDVQREGEKAGEKIGEKIGDETARREGMTDESMAAGEKSFKYRRVTELVGLAVKNPQGERLGDIEDLVVDRRESRIAYAYLSFGGLLGLGEKMAAVPWSAIQIRPRLDMARLDANKSVLEAIAFEQGKDPNLSDTQVASRLHERFAQEPYWEIYGYTPTEPGAQRPTGDAWKAGSQYNMHFKADTIVEMKGTIQSVGTFTPAPNSTPGVRLSVRGDDGKTSTVHVGPQNYVAQKGIQFNYGDEITVKGSRVEIDGRTVLVATEIKSRDKTLELRDNNGQPKWKAEEQ